MTTITAIARWWITLLDGRTPLATALLTIGLCGLIVIVVLWAMPRRRATSQTPVRTAPRAAGIGPRRVA